MPEKIPTTPNPLTDFLCFSVYSAGHAFNRLYRTLLDELGLTYPQYLVMQLLWTRDGQSVKAIGRDLKLESNTLTPLLKRLESLGLVERRRDRADERVVRIHLTGAGRDLQGMAARIPGCVADAAGLSGAELAALGATLDKVRDRLLEASEEAA